MACRKSVGSGEIHHTVCFWCMPPALRVVRPRICSGSVNIRLRVRHLSCVFLSTNLYSRAMQAQRTRTAHEAQANERATTKMTIHIRYVQGLRFSDPYWTHKCCCCTKRCPNY
eukprot:5996914-Amphidinium_carterae.1